MDSNDIYNTLLPECKPGREKTLWFYIQWCIQKHLESADMEYTESHHIIPKSLFPEYASFNINPWNCSVLSARDHYLAHFLLARAIPRMTYALWLMSDHSNLKTGYKVTALEYQTARLARSRWIKENKAGSRWIYLESDPTQTRVIEKDTPLPEGWAFGNPYADQNSGKNVYHNPETGKVIMHDPNDPLPEGFVPGSGMNPAGDMTWCHDPDNPSDERYVKKGSIPSGFEKGRPGLTGSTWYYDPNTRECKQFKPGDEPKDWVKGFPEAGNKDKKLCHDPETRESKYVSSDEEIPKGWVKGGPKAKTATCQHCGKTGNVAPMTRFHFDNCKYKKD